jgi:hypothetical protein
MKSVANLVAAEGSHGVEGVATSNTGKLLEMP